jgi:hypothetical protein
MSREVPAEFETKRASWLKSSQYWYRINIALTVISALLSGAVGVNAKVKVLHSDWVAFALGILAAALTSLLTALHADKKSAAYTIASRDLDAAIFEYRSTPKLAESYLSDAVTRGSDLLNKNAV